MIRSFHKRLIIIYLITFICTIAQAQGKTLLRGETQKDTLRLAVKTNLLYDAASVVNFAVEFPIKEKFSALYEHHCPWWV